MFVICSSVEHSYPSSGLVFKSDFLSIRPDDFGPKCPACPIQEISVHGDMGCSPLLTMWNTDTPLQALYSNQISYQFAPMILALNVQLVRFKRLVCMVTWVATIDDKSIFALEFHGSEVELTDGKRRITLSEI
ncbi:hypothetical protein CEXT_143461 [Caerostris extrusa]|uniref:Uncharacterized protein n=1 Tax=Caerostris extrusa TaxID=172846 RepID=A0AAV4XPM1_CAEEX|nr:hypothetical protein CEXT_143461 [Caerostris extrusa]